MVSDQRLKLPENIDTNRKLLIDQFVQDGENTLITYPDGKKISYGKGELNLHVIVKGNDKTKDITLLQRKGNKFEIFFRNSKKSYPYNQENVLIVSSPLAETSAKDCLDYLKAIANEIKEEVVAEKKRKKSHDNEEEDSVDERSFLASQYAKLETVHPDSVLASFLSGRIEENLKTSPEEEFGDDCKWDAIYPFGFNNSQKQAIDHAFPNRISIIKGPPGTGKTQTILNIISNIVLQGKTVAVVSGNNSATENVLEKLTQSNLGFFAALLGKKENKKKFIADQKPFPDTSSWKISREEDPAWVWAQITNLSLSLESMLHKKNDLSALRLELERTEVERRHFTEYFAENYKIDYLFGDKGFPFPIGETLIESVRLSLCKLYNYFFENPPVFLQTSLSKLNKSSGLKELCLLCQEYAEAKEDGFRPGVVERFLNRLRYGINHISFYDDPDGAMTRCQMRYFDVLVDELSESIQKLEKEVEDFDLDNKLRYCTDLSLRYLKSELSERYSHTKVQTFCLDDLWRHPDEFLKTYPVILSTTHSLRSSLSPKILYDYVIVDEASQADLASGALALSCARKAIVVGDLKQLPHVVRYDVAKKTDAIFSNYSLKEAYRYKDHCLLAAIELLFPEAPKTLLREHYRCHPKIIGFCNMKFYDGELFVLTKPEGNRIPLVAYTTNPGNHAREHLNQRQIDVIKQEVIPQQKLNVENATIGIVTPYRQQTNALQTAFKGTQIKADTVDKFQGRERDVIILSTVDNEVNEFSDNPNRLNVAISRAISQLIVVASQDDMNRDTNLGDLINYINYNNCAIINSKVYSVFDLLYKPYDKIRREFLAKRNRISEYDSEELAYAMIEKVLNTAQFKRYNVAHHYGLRSVIRDTSLLDDDEAAYALNKKTHIDFLIYEKFGMMPRLAIEIDGVSFHREGTRQAVRDQMKNSIFEKYGLAYLRFRTDGSGEEQRLRDALVKLTI